MTTDYHAALKLAADRLRATNYADQDAWDAVREAGRRLAQTAGEPWAEVLDLGPTWAAGAPLPHVVSGEQVCVLVCRAAEVDPAWDGTSVTMVSPSDDEPSVLLVYTFRYFHSIKFGGPNDEALNGHPLHGRGLVPYRAHRVHNSSWLSAEERINAVHPQHRPEAFQRLRHFVFAFQDQLFEALALDVEVRVVRSTMADQLRGAVNQLTAPGS